VGLLKTLVKLALLLTLSAMIAGVVFMVKRPKNEALISFEEWPSVPRNPAA
jgi:hypothetical protein